MFYCETCAKKKHWPQSLSQSFGQCELCGKRNLCNDVESSQLPPMDQPPPVPNGHPAVWSLVIADMEARDKVGRERYGTPLQPFNGRDTLADAYAEALDLAVYLRTAMIEIDGLKRQLDEVLTPTRSPDSPSHIQQANAWRMVYKAAVDAGLLSFLDRLDGTGAERVVAFIGHLKSKS